MRILRIDHLVLTVTDLVATCNFYERILGFEAVEKDGRWSLHFGEQKLNLHQRGHEYEPKAAHPLPGSADVCFVSADPLDELMAQLLALGVEIEQGPVERVGAMGPMFSVYFRDPDRNLIEVARYKNERHQSL